MAKGAQTVPEPSPTGKNIADKFGQYADEYLQLSKDQFQVAEARQKELDALTQQVIQRNTELGNLTLEQQRQLAGYNAAIADRISAQGQDFTRRGGQLLDRYDQEFVPLEQDIVGFARDFDTPARRAEAAAKAKADVQSASVEQRQIAQRRQAALGVDPRSGRYAAVDRAGDLGTALASVGAQNTARENVENKGIALRSDAAQLGRSLQGAGTNLAGLGIQAGSTAAGLRNTTQQLNNTASQIAMNVGAANLGAQQQANQLSAGNLGILQQGYGGAGQLLGNQVNTISAQDQALLDRYQIQGAQNNANTSGIWNAIGTGVGWFLSDENLKENKKQIDDGEALEAVNNMRVEEWDYNDGVADEGTHIGTYAQDFTEQTGLGNGKKINAQDAIGVTMKAVQDLSKKVDDLAVGISREGRKISSSTRDKKLKKLEQQQQLDHQQAIGTMAA